MYINKDFTFDGVPFTFQGEYTPGTPATRDYPGDQDELIGFFYVGDYDVTELISGEAMDKLLAKVREVM